MTKKNVRQFGIHVAPDQNHYIDILKNGGWGNTQRGPAKDIENSEAQLWPTKSSVKYYGKTLAAHLQVIVAGDITYEAYDEKTEDGYYGWYSFGKAYTVPYYDMVAYNGGNAPELNSAPLKK